MPVVHSERAGLVLGPQDQPYLAPSPAPPAPPRQPGLPHHRAPPRQPGLCPHPPDPNLVWSGL